MRGYLICFLLFIAIEVQSQVLDSVIVFYGYVFDQDSLPIENALIVNYRTLKPCLTNSKGYFRVLLKQGDSLLINHISYERKIVKASNHYSGENKIYMTFEPYEIRPVTIKYRDIEIENFNKNMKLMNAQMRSITPAYRTGTEYNTYAPQRKDQVFGINVVELLNWIRTYNYRNGK